MDQLRVLLTKHMALWQSSWSMGTFGAIAYAPVEAVELKKRMVTAISDGTPCAAFEKPATRLERSTLRVGLRQQLAFARSQGDHQRAETILAWQKAFDREAGEAETDDDSPGH